MNCPTYASNITLPQPLGRFVVFSVSKRGFKRHTRQHRNTQSNRCLVFRGGKVHEGEFAANRKGGNKEMIKKLMGTLMMLAMSA
ncbi:MAG TPA: hypothetical protein VHL54_03955, partial [Actinomycetota bacterium]|nr:hypothetical protein [Actinomycetota bacterium]